MSEPAIKQIVIASRPKGLPTRENFRPEEVPMPALPQGGLLLRVLYNAVGDIVLAPTGWRTHAASAGAALRNGRRGGGGMAVEVVSTAQRLDRVIRDVDSVAFGQPEQGLGLNCPFDVQMQLGLRQPFDEPHLQSLPQPVFSSCCKPEKW